MNEFYIKKAKVDVSLFDATCKDSARDAADGVVFAQPIPGFIEKLPGRKSLKLTLVAAGAFDEKAIMDAMDNGRAVKLLFE